MLTAGGYKSNPSLKKQRRRLEQTISNLLTEFKLSLMPPPWLAAADIVGSVGRP